MQAPYKTGLGLLLHRMSVILIAFAVFTAAEDTMADPCSLSTVTFTINNAVLSGSDTYISIPVTPAPVFCGWVSSISGSAITVVDDTGATPNFTGQSWYGAAHMTYYVIFTSGVKQGEIYTTNAIGAASVTVNTPTDCGDDLTGVLQGGKGVGDQLAIIPYWTLNTVWPGGAGVTGANSAANGTDILLWNPVTQSSALYWYRTTGATPGWRSSASAVVSANDQIIQPNWTILIHQQVSKPTLNFTVTGSEIEYQTASCLYAPGLAYSFVSNNHYYPTGGQTLGASGLANAFTPSYPFASPPQYNDELLLYDNTATGFNKAPIHTYIYFNNSGTWIWGDLNHAPITTDRSSDLVFTPGTGVVISKAAASSTKTYWYDPY